MAIAERKLVRNLSKSTKKALRLVLDEYIGAMDFIKSLRDPVLNAHKWSDDTRKREAFDDSDVRNALRCLSWMKKASYRLDKTLQKIEKEMNDIDEQLEPRGEDSMDKEERVVKFGDIKLKRGINVDEKDLIKALEERRKILLTLVSKYGKGSMEKDLDQIVKLIDSKTPKEEQAVKLLGDLMEENPQRYEELMGHLEREYANIKKEDESLLKWLISTQALLEKIIDYNKEVGRMLLGREII